MPKCKKCKEEMIHIGDKNEDGYNLFQYYCGECNIKKTYIVCEHCESEDMDWEENYTLSSRELERYFNNGGKE